MKAETFSTAYGATWRLEYSDPARAIVQAAPFI
jgi:hypothetical protein